MKRLNNQTTSSMTTKSLLAGYHKWIYLMVIVGMIGLIASCDTTAGLGGIPEIEGVRHVHPDSAAAKQMEKVGPGEMFVIVGRNLTSTKQVFFNGIEASFNPTLVTDKHMIIRVPGDIPFGRLDPDAPEMNTIRLTADAGETTFDFPILPPAPEIERVNKEFATAGETVRITGRFLYLIENVTFPGGVQAPDYNIDENGTWLAVTVPEGVTEAGHINVTTSSGTTEENYRNMFNDRQGIFINYDDKNPYTPWGTPGTSAPYVGQDVQDIPPLDGNYIHWHYTDPLTPGMWWFQGLATPHATWAGLTFPDYPADTPTSELVFRMEVYTPHDKFKSGYIQLSFDWWIEKDWNPFIVNGERVPLATNGWETVTIPLNEFTRGNPPEYGPYRNSGEFLLRYVNPGAPDGAAFEEVNVAFDNLRIVRKS